MRTTDPRISDAFSFLSHELGSRTFGAAVVLGSGFSEWVKSLRVRKDISYQDIPGFPATTVEGHHGRFMVIETGPGRQILVMQGRLHYYEGYHMSTIAVPIRVLHRLGVQQIVLTNAAGGINREYHPGEMMVISDHINLTGSNPLIGPNDDTFGPRFPDASSIYTPTLRAMAIKHGTDLGLKMQQGVYVFSTGPSFETPAEIRMMSVIGGDAVGMSTVPEAVVANHCGMQVLGLSLIANPAAGMNQKPLTHRVVMDTMQLVSSKIHLLLNRIVEEMNHPSS